jgi:hypothetical protein
VSEYYEQGSESAALMEQLRGMNFKTYSQRSAIKVASLLRGPGEFSADPIAYTSSLSNAEAHNAEQRRLQIFYPANYTVVYTIKFSAPSIADVPDVYEEHIAEFTKNILNGNFTKFLRWHAADLGVGVLLTCYSNTEPVFSDPTASSATTSNSGIRKHLCFKSHIHRLNIKEALVPRTIRRTVLLLV